MHISKNSATQIVEEISKLVKQNINLMDETGHIIASRDKSRIGDFHYGAYKIISENLEEYYIDEDDLSKGIKKGINLPLELDGGIVGVIGMTGGYEEVITSGKLLKKMTEILLMESRANYRQLMNKRVRNAFYEEWLINGGYKNADLEDRGMALGIDINKPRRVFIASIDELDNLKDSQQGQSQIAKFENDVDAFLKRNNYKMHFRNASRQIIIIDNMDTENVVKFAGELAGYVWEKDKFELNIGIDSAQSYDMHEAYVEAHRAWTAAAEKHEQIICYEDRCCRSKKQMHNLSNCVMFLYFVQLRIAKVNPILLLSTCSTSTASAARCRGWRRRGSTTSPGPSPASAPPTVQSVS